MKQKIQNSQTGRFQLIKKQVSTRQITTQPAQVKNISGSTIDVTLLF